MLALDLILLYSTRMCRHAFLCIGLVYFESNEYILLFNVDRYKQDYTESLT